MESNEVKQEPLDQVIPDEEGTFHYELAVLCAKHGLKQWLFAGIDQDEKEMQSTESFDFGLIAHLNCCPAMTIDTLPVVLLEMPIRHRARLAKALLDGPTVRANTSHATA